MGHILGRTKLRRERDTQKKKTDRQTKRQTEKEAKDREDRL